MTDQNFVHIHVHTEYSLLDGLSRIRKLVSRAKELEMPAVAITDHGTMFGVIDFYRACKEAEVKPLIGMEAYLSPRGMEDRDPKLDKRAFHLLLLARDEAGYRNLLKIASEGQLRGYYYRPRIDRDFLANHSAGLIATSGCLAAQIPGAVAAGNDEEARNLVGWYQDVFGAENFFLELQQHNIPELAVLNKWLVDYRQSGHSAVQLVATNDVHYVNQADADAQDTLLCIQTGALKAEENRMKMSDPTYHLATQQEMWRMFKEVPEALQNSLKIAAMCDVNLDTEGYHLPVFPVPPGFDSLSYLRHLCQMGLAWRYGARKNEPVLQQRLDRELSIINNMGFNTYFLIVWDLCEYARSVDIWWNVRGSGAGSLVAYCLGITNIDPIQNSLLFERFLNPGRVSMPDIDIDYPDDRRGEMISYAARKYGEDKVAAIITFGTMGPKAAVRDIGRALNVPLPLVNKTAAMIPTEPRPKPIMEYVDANPELKALYKAEPQIKLVIDTAVELQGVSRHASTHAAGVIVGDRPLVEYLPLHRITGTDPSGGALKAVTQFPMETCESIGLLKIDFLGLSTLTILRKACDLIERHQKIRYNMDNIPYRHDDPKLTPEQVKMLDQAFEMLGRGETVGVFQVESGGMQQMLRGMRPKRFENIIAGISLYRPGPMEFIPQYNRRLHGEEDVDYRHPRLEPILAETYGIITYQEQIMQIAGELFGYELGEADLMRRAVSKKKQKDLLKHKEIFIQRGPEHGVDTASAEQIFADIEFFANYGFNKSHAADYAVITVQTAYLKAHYPHEYVTALLCVHRDDSGKVATFLDECRRLNIPILPPDVNRSMTDFDIEALSDGRRGVRFGMAAVKNAGAESIQHIISAREEGGIFTDLGDFCRRIDLRAVGKRTLESLIKVGALHDFGGRSTLLNGIERIINYSIHHHNDQKVGQMNLFGGVGVMQEDLLQNLTQIVEVGEREMLGWEKELLGLYVTGRPVDKFREALRDLDTHRILTIKESEGAMAGRNVKIAGEITSLRKIITKNNDLMAVITLEDWHDTADPIEVVLFPRTWKLIDNQFREKGKSLEEGEIIVVFGKVDFGRGEAQIICDKIITDFSVMTADVPSNGLRNHGRQDFAPPDEDEPPAWIMEENNRDFINDMPVWANLPDAEFDEETGEVASPLAAEEAPPLDDAVAPASQGGVAAPTLALEPQMGKVISIRTAPGFEADPEWSPYDEDSPQERRRLTIFFSRSGSPEKDRRRLRILHNTLVAYPGRDRFVIMLEDRHRPVKMEFPNHTTGYCDDLLRDLLSIVSEENIHVELIGT